MRRSLTVVLAALAASVTAVKTSSQDAITDNNYLVALDLYNQYHPKDESSFVNFQQFMKEKENKNLEQRLEAAEATIQKLETK